MGLTKQLKLDLSDGTPCLVRTAEPGDARELVAYYNVVGGESPYMDFGEGEFYLDKKQERHVINQLRATDNCVPLVAIVAGEIVGSFEIHGQLSPRMRHTGWLGITVARDFWGTGVAGALMDWGVRWAEESPVLRKLNLITRADNARAIALFRKFGFEEEGRVLRLLVSDGRFHDALCMGRAV